MAIELAESVEDKKEITTVEVERKEKVLEINRVVQAVLHFNEQDPRAKWIRDWLRRQLIMVARAEREALQLLTAGLRVEKDEAGKIILAELRFAAASPDDVAAACKLLQKRSFASSDEGKSARQSAQPAYTNSYRLVEVSRHDGKDYLRFVLMERYSYLEDRGARAGQEVSALTSLPIKFLQRIITRWLRPPLFDELPPVLKNGAAQEVAQAIGSHLGLSEAGTQPSVGLPSMEREIQPALFVGSGDIVVYCRRSLEAKRAPRIGLWASLPLTSADTAETSWLLVA